MKDTKIEDLISRYNRVTKLQENIEDKVTIILSKKFDRLEKVSLSNITSYYSIKIKEREIISVFAYEDIEKLNFRNCRTSNPGTVEEMQEIIDNNNEDRRQLREIAKILKVKTFWSLRNE